MTIDYDKIKLSSELSSKYYEKTGLPLLIEHHFAIGELSNHTCVIWINGKYEAVCDIDTAISKLKKLTQPDKEKPKYAVGDRVWFIDCYPNKFEQNIVLKGQPIINIDIDEDEIRYVFHGEFCWKIKEQDVYPSRISLVESQIEYWNKLIYPTIEEQTMRRKVL